MAGKACLTLTGRQRDEAGQESVTELSTAADYEEKDGCIYIFYEEAEGQEPEAVCRNLIKIEGSVLEVTKRGPISSRMVFEAGKLHRTDYATPYGTLRLEVSTRRLTLSLQEDGAEAHLEYTLISEGRLLSDCALSLSLRILGQEDAQALPCPRNREMPEISRDRETFQGPAPN